jgi:thymidylate synthase
MLFSFYYFLQTLMKNYLNLCQDILDNGERRSDRTGVGRISVFGRQLRFNLQEGFPLLTTKKVFIRGVIEELLWFLRGSTSANELIEKDVHIWDGWRVTDKDIKEPTDKIKNVFEIDKSTSFTRTQEVKDELRLKLGDLGPVYGAMWRNAPGNADTRFLEAVHGNNYKEEMLVNMASDKRKVFEATEFSSEMDKFETLKASYFVVDQIQELILNLKRNPLSSRHIVSGWIPQYLPDERLTPQENVLLGRQVLPPCHVMFQLYVNLPKEPNGKMRLSLQLMQRSCDTYLGIPFNIASYALLTMMIAQCVDMEPFEFIHCMGDTHFYFNQKEAVKEQLKRVPTKLPTMTINPEVRDIYSFKVEDFTLSDYNPPPAIKVAVAI